MTDPSHYRVGPTKTSDGEDAVIYAVYPSQPIPIHGAYRSKTSGNWVVLASRSGEVYLPNATPTTVSRWLPPDGSLTVSDTEREGWSRVDVPVRAIPIAPQPVAVTVKPLVWFENPDIGEGGYIAKGIFGVTYHAMDDGWSYYRQGLWADASGLYAAKAAAQAEYEDRILSAIEATPARDVRAAALREAAAEAAGEIAAHGHSELSAFLRRRILALIDKEAAK